MDTKKGYRVVVELDSDQAEQLTRLLDMAKMIDGRRIDTEYIEDERRHDTMDIIGYRAFLEEILVLIRDAIQEQQPN
jgi:hypothetical protein